MKYILIIAILFSLQSQAQLGTTSLKQVSGLIYKTADSLRKEYKAANAAIITRLNNQNDDRIALEARFTKIIDSIRNQLSIEVTKIKALQVSIDSTDFEVVNSILKLRSKIDLSEMQLRLELFVGELDKIKKSIPNGLTYPQ